MRIKSPMPIILKKDCVEFDLKKVNGAWFLFAGKFKQHVKQSEYEKIMANAVIPAREDAPVLPDFDGEDPLEEKPKPKRGR
jgi:hypothetical protein